MVELLTVLAILSLLIQLLIPGVMAAREAARNTACQNHLRQLGIAAANHEVAHRTFPTGGWTYFWIGDPDLGVDDKQPGGWTFNILPYMEQAPLHQTRAGTSDDQKKNTAVKLLEAPIADFICPTRRLAKLYPCPSGDFGNYIATSQCAKSDYASNAGDFYEGLGLPKPGERGVSFYDSSQYTGIMYHRSQVRYSQVSDGTTHTYLMGEKALPKAAYKTGTDLGDDQSLWVGCDGDNTRWTRTYDGQQADLPLARDTEPAGNSYLAFGGPHPRGVNFAMCDGSVRPISFDLDTEVHRSLSNRADGNTIEF